MMTLVTGAELAFWLLAPLMVIAALGVVLSRKPVHSALWMVFVMVALAIQFASLSAHFLFVAQIIVYTGAIMMLFLFVVMLVGVDTRDSVVETIRGQRLMAVLAALAFAVLLLAGVGNLTDIPAAGLDDANEGGNAVAIAMQLFSEYALVFQAAAGLLLIATVGAMVLAHRERVSKKKTQIEISQDAMQAYAEHGTHPGGLPASGVFARHNGVDAPALLPDGSVAEASVSKTLQARGVMLQGENLADPTRRTLAAVDPDATEEVAGRAIGQDKPADHHATSLPHTAPGAAEATHREPIVGRADAGELPDAVDHGEVPTEGNEER